MITTNLFEEVLINPAIKGANKLLIVSGYATSAMAFHHLEKIKDRNKFIEIQLIVGMAIQDGLSLSNHKGFQQLVEKDFKNEFFCSYIFSRPAVHSKVFIWCSDDIPVLAFTGSANYTQTAFIRKQKEVLAECNPKIAFDYFYEQVKNSIYCTHNDAENLVQIFSDRQLKQKVLKDSKFEQKEQLQIVSGIGDLSELQNVCISFLDRSGNLPQRSGLNWGQRPEYNREPNQAYIRVPRSVAVTGFFPPKGTHFTVLTDDDKVFTCTIAQAGDKAIETPHNNSQIGEYFRRRLKVRFGDPVLKEHLERYGKHEVCFYKIDDETYYMDFSN